MSETVRAARVRKPPAPRCGGTLRRPVERYLAALYANASAGSLIEVRYRAAAGMRRAFHDVERQDLVAAAIIKRAPDTDVYVGVLPRRRPAGGRNDLVPVGSVLWADCDTPESVAALDDFPVPPSILVASGTGDNRHAYWSVDAPLPIDELERLNRALACSLGADPSCAEPARILRPPSLNHKHDPPARVQLVRCDATARYRPADFVDAVGDQADEPMRHRLPRPAQRAQDDRLLQVAPTMYVERLSGLRVPRHGKIRCPFHDDRTPSLHVYSEPEQGWYCYGCNRGGTVYDFAALLSGRTTRGADFVQLQDELRAQLGDCGPIS